MMAVPAAPAPDTTTRTPDISLPTTRSALVSAASTTMAVRCWSSWKTGMLSLSRSRASISKHRGAAMSSRLIPPYAGAMAVTILMISSVSCVSRTTGQASTPPNRLNSAALPSITGGAAAGPMLPRPSTAGPSVTTATVLRLMVSRRASSGFSAIAMQTRATPGVYARESSSRVRSATFGVTSIFPPRCSRNVRSETLRTSTPGSTRRAATTSLACSASAVSQVTSARTVTGSESTTSRAVTIPPAPPTAVVSRPMAEGSAGRATRLGMENPALRSALVLDGLIQRRGRPDASTFIGKGKVSELRDVVVDTGADTVICDGELSPSQLRTLEQEVKVKVIDRTALILDIFAQHAKSKEGKAQVELAQLQYFLPRLRGWGEALSRQAGGSGRGGGAGGGVGLRGPGETKLETDRRRIRTRISKLKREIEAMRVIRATKRAGRRRNAVPAVAIAGYTNAGKSSLLNRLTGAGVLVENALFATLDPTTRRARTADGRIHTLSDPAGSVRHLPHQLVEAFRSTLEEVAQADLVVHVVDGAHADPEEQVRAVREVLAEVGADKVPELLVINKIDAADEETVLRLKRTWPDAVLCSAP